MSEETEIVAVDFDNDTTCSVCYAEFLDPEDLEVHVSQVHATRALKSCKFCLSPYSDMNEYAWHIIEAHITSAKCCKYCSRIFINYDEHRKHETKHHMSSAESVFSCSNCKSAFEDRNDLEHHEIESHADSNEGVSLHDCYNFLSSYLNMKTEAFLRSLNKQRVNFSCIICKYSTTRVKSYVKHLITKKCQSLVCNTCSDVFPTKISLEKHFDTNINCAKSKTMSKRNVIKRICQECNQYVDVRAMMKHRKLCKKIKCNSCNIIFETMDKLTEHQSKEHPLAIMLEYCKYCHKEFVGKVSLERHIERTHKDELHLYKYYCVYCDNVFKHPKRLFAHFFCKHKELEPYTCKICNIKFRLRKKLTLHIKMDHKSEGFVEFDENFHVFFTDKKSKHPFVPCAEEQGALDPEDNLKQKLKNDIKDQSEKEGYTETDINTEFMNMTETDVNYTKIELEPKKKLKRKRKFKHTNGNTKKKFKTKSKIRDEIDEISDINSDDDDQPLLVLRQRGKKRNVIKEEYSKIPILNKKEIKKSKKTKFICQFCKRNCYTFQHYHNHMSLHCKKGSKKCIKCNKLFKTKAGLKEHMSTLHSTSKLTETLKNLLERRKRGEALQETPISTREKFLKTITKVPVAKNDAVVTITPLEEKGLSVQKFIENFVPEESTKKNLRIEAIVTMKICPEPVPVNSKIKMKQFTPEKVSMKPIKLSLPKMVKFNNAEQTKVSVKVVQKSVSNNKPKLNFGTSLVREQDITQHMNEEIVEPDQYEETIIDYEYDNQDNYIGDQKPESSIPEVAQEVMLESNLETEEMKMPPQIQSTLVIPKLPEAYGSIRIAHLLPEAPYFKIVKVDDYLKEQEEKTGKDEDDQEEDVKLPGTKLVNVNPLAHLLGDKPVESLMLSTNKHYQPKTKNFEKAIAKALLQLENPGLKMKNKKKKMEIEQ